MPVFAIQSNGSGIAYKNEQGPEYSEANMEEWRSNVTTTHKGGTFCGTTYSKEMAIFNQVINTITTDIFLVNTAHSLLMYPSG